PPSPETQPEDPTPAYLAAADPTIPLSQFIELVGSAPKQLLNQQSLLFPSCITGSLDKTTWLLTQGLDPNHADHHAYTPLIYACLPGRSANLDLLQHLLNLGADPNARSSHHESPLSLLTREGNYEGAHLLIIHGADPTDFPPLHQAAAAGDLPKIIALLSPQTIEQQNSWARTPWLTAIHADQIPAAQFLESQGANTEATGHTGDSALHLAAEANACASLTYLLSQGHPLEARASFGNTPLHNAVENDSLDTARLLLDAGADLHALTETADAPISFADSVPMLELLHAHGANLNQLTSDGRHLLQNFADGNDLPAIQWLLAHGADLTLLTPEDRALIKSLLTT
ncbi:MAG: ankyrin repeat domain-containing protein, partial [Verrucomicrobia bacterium]|nr:ankyrin repeat domain-containing protein [Verrucomicrobiota bacterium]